MGESSSISLSIFSVLLVFSVLWNPAYTDDKCSIGCKGSSSGPSYLNNHKYNYAVEGVVSVYLTGADKQETSVKLNGQVSVSAQGNCGYVLRVQSIQISGPDGKKYTKPPGIDKPVRFTLQDGKVGSELCTEDGDTRRSLNIKRAIISLLQSSTKASTETDVFGVCPTDLTSSQEGGSVLVHRSRDLSRCGMREQGRHDLITGVYDSQAEIKNTQVLQSLLNVESKVNNGVPEKVSATEEYLYKPFSVGQNGARAKVHTKLTLTGKSGGSDNGKFTEVRSIIFENPHGVKSEHSNLQAAVRSLKDTSKAVQRDAASKSAGEFAQFVRILRVTSKDDLIKLYNQAKGNNLEKRVYLDGLLRTGTGAGIEASIQLLKNKELTPFEQKLVYLSLGNAKHVTNEAVKAAATLLDQPNIPKEVYLGVGALGGAYCHEHRCHGASSQSAGVAALSQKLASKLHNCKPKNKQEEDFIIAALKGIRSIRHIEDSLVDKLAQCVTDKNVKARVKVAALEAFHADPCTAKLKKVALDTMKNRQLDSEIRIKAYLAVIDCPCGKSANEIKTLLETEPVQQVGRYISTSLRHIRTSANPDKQLAKQHYGLIRTPNKFEVDDRKYSFYREESFDIDALGIGGNVEQSVIFSQDSFVPRSASLNLTAQLFGHSLNVLEIGGRQGNLDRVVEHFLGPKSFLRTQKPQDIYDNFRNKLNDMEKKVEGKIRGRRALKQDIDNFDKQVKAEALPYNNELDLDIYVKLFGTDAIFLSLGDDKGFNVDAVLDEVLKQLDSGMNQAKHFQQDLRAHLLFLDAELAYPTSTGFALKLNLVGSATGRLELSTAVDFRQIFRDPNNAKVDIKLVPSTDIEVSGLFLVDADSVSTGLKVVTNLHTSTGGHLIAKMLENGNGVDLQFGLPTDKLEIITASSDLVFVTREKGQKDKEVALKIDTDKKDYSGCFDQLSGVLGLTFCGEVSVPFSVSGPEAQTSIQKFLARYPLTGPGKVKVRLEKNDLRGYHLKYLLRVQDASRKNFELLLEAEGGQNRRTSVSGELVNTKEEKSIKLSLESPIKTAHAELSLITKPNEYTALAKAKWDAEVYYGRAGVTAADTRQGTVYRPIVEYQLPGSDGMKSLKVDGQILKQVNGPSTKYSLENIKVNMPNSNEIVDINGYFIQDAKSVVELKAKKGDQNGFIKGSLINKDVALEFQNTLNPNINFKLTGHSDNDCKKKYYQNDIDIYFGGDLKSDKQRVTFNQLLKFAQTSAEDYSLVTKNKLSIPILPVVVKANADVDPKKVEVEMEAQYMDTKANLDVKARTHIKRPGDYNVKLEAKAMDKGVEIFAKRDFIDADKSNFENYISIKDVGKYELSGIVSHKTKSNDVNIGATGHLKLRTGKSVEDINFDFGFQENHNLYSTHLKLNTQSELVNYLLKINRGPNPNGEFKLILWNDFSTNGQYKMTDSDGKGNGGFIIHFKKADRKYKGDVNFVLKEPVFNADVDLFLNFGKDNKDKIHFSTHNKKTETLIDSKNQLTYDGKKSEVNVKAEGEWDGKSDIYTEVVLPTERVLSLKFNRDAKEHDGNFEANSETVLADAPTRGAPPSKFVYKHKYNANHDKDIFNYDGEWGVYLKDNKNLIHSMVIKNNPIDGDKYKIQFVHDIKGSLMPEPYHANGFIDYVNDDELVDGEYTYLLRIAYGDQYSFNYAGYWELYYIRPEKKYLENFKINLRLPIEKFKTMDLDSSLLFLMPDDKETFLDYSVSYKLSVNNVPYSAEASGKIAKSNGFTKVKVLLRPESLVLDTSYHNPEEGPRNATLNIHMDDDKGKKYFLNSELIQHSDHDFEMSFQGSLPPAGTDVELVVRTQNPTPETLNTDLKMVLNKQQIQSTLGVVYSKHNPLMDLKINLSDQKPITVHMKGTAISDNHGKLEVKFENIKDVSFDGFGEAKLDQDNVLYRFEGNSEKWGLSNYKAEISSKDVGSGKRLEFQASNHNKNILSGSTSYISKQEGPKMIIEGSGSVKVENQQKSASFKYIRTVLTDGNEQGLETFMNVAVGERSYVAESRVTNLEYKTSYVYCEEKKQCAHAELNSKLSTQPAGAFQHTVNIILDLRKLGISPEFGLQLKNELEEQYRLLSVLDVHLNKDDKKYHLHVYNKPKRGGHMGYESGLSLTLPKRTLALESSFSAGSKPLPFPLGGEVALYMDKNKPQQKVAAKMLMDLKGSDNEHTFKAEFTLHHPKMPQDTGLNLQGTWHHDAVDQFMFEGIASVTQEGQSKILLDVHPNSMKFLVETPIVKVINADASVTMKENHQECDLKFSLLQGKPVQMKALAKEFKYFEFTTGYSEDAQRKLSIVGRIEPDQRMDLSADIVLPGAKKNIFHSAIFIKDDLLKTDYGTSKENFDYFINALKSDMDKLQVRVNQLNEKTQADVKAKLERYKANLKRVEEDYQQELEKLKHELVNDETLKDMDKAFREVIHFIARITDDIVRVTSAIATNINNVVFETWSRLYDLYEKELKPHIVKITESTVAIISEYTDGVIDIIAHYGAMITDFMEKHKAELKNLTDTMNGIFKELTRILVSRLKELRVSLASIMSDITQQIKEMPMIAMLKDKIAELAIPESAVQVLNEMHNMIKDILPTEEGKKLVSAIFVYLEKKIMNEKVDDEAELRKISESMAVALSSLIDFIKQQINQYGVPGMFNLNFIPTFVTPGESWPTFGGSVSFSALNDLLTGDFPDPMAYIRAYRPRSLNPIDEIPAKMRGVVVNGQHIFTFDGSHLTFPGNCRYVLVHDHVDRNFTLVMQMQNGLPKALALEDRSGAIIEIKDNGQATLNGANHGFPVKEKDIVAFKETSGRLGLWSEYGLLALCTPKLTVCYVEVSGFYLGKLRGLLGDGNNEAFDDFRLPNGKIVTSQAEFGNAYRLPPSCGQVQTPEHSHHQLHAQLPPACQQVFGPASTLWPLSLLLDVAPFRQACIHAVAANGASALREACDLGRGYAELANTGLLPALLPPACVRCTDSDKPKEVGDVYEVKLPNKQADVVVLVETTKANEKAYKDLVVPVVSQVVDALKQKHVDDIKVYLLGITPRLPYPIIYDTENVKLKGAKVSFQDERRYRPLLQTVTFNVSNIDQVEKVVVKFIDDLAIFFGATNVVTGYNRALELPLRPGAVKTTISLVSEHCRKSFLPLELARMVVVGTMFEMNAMTHSLFTVTPDLTIGGGKSAQQIIGYDSSSVMMLGDKKRGKDTEQLRSHLKNGPDACVDFVEGTDGVIFSATNFASMNGGQQKQFIQTAGQVIVDRMTRLQLQQECTCTYVDSYNARSVCIRKEAKDTARRRK